MNSPVQITSVSFLMDCKDIILILYYNILCDIYTSYSIYINQAEIYIYIRYIYVYVHIFLFILLYWDSQLVSQLE